jgi:citrate synthase
MEPWRTAIANSDEANIWIRGYDIGSLMRRASFADLLFLLHRSRLATPSERRLLDAILIAVADHGAGAPSCAAARLAASGNRQSLSAGHRRRTADHRRRTRRGRLDCMEMIAPESSTPRRSRCRSPSRPVRPSSAAGRGPARAGPRASRAHRWIPAWTSCSTWRGEAGLAGDGIAFVRALEAAARVQIKPFPSTSMGRWPPCSTTWAFRPRPGSSSSWSAVSPG